MNINYFSQLIVIELNLICVVVLITTVLTPGFGVILTLVVSVTSRTESETVTLSEVIFFPPIVLKLISLIVAPSSAKEIVKIL